MTVWVEQENVTVTKKIKLWLFAFAGLFLITGVLTAAAIPAGATTVSSEAAFRAAYGNAAETSITLGANVTLTNCGAGQLSRNSANALTLHGKGHTVRQSCSAGAFAQDGVGTLTLDSVALVAKRDFDAITSAGRVVLVDSSISNVGGASGINNGTTTVLTRSTITGLADDGVGVNSGGAVSLTQSRVASLANADCEGVSNGANTTLNQSTVSGCTNGVDSGADVFLTNSTIVDASVDGIVATNTTTLLFSTIIHNGTGVHGGTLVSTGSVVAKSTTADCNLTGHTSHGYNFSGDGSCSFNQGTDRSNGGDPHLGALADNGGPTTTMLPQANSPLLNKVPKTKCALTTDQRNVARPQDGKCDIGAVEVAAAQGYRLGEVDGGVANFGDAQNHGSLPALGITPNRPIVGIDPTPSGYRLAGAEGSVFSFGSATFHGSLPSLGIHPTKPIVGMAATSNGYWLVAADGGVFGFGNAAFHGSLPSLGIHPNKPIVGITATANGGGYWLVGADGGVFRFGNAAFHGALPTVGVPTAPVVGIAPTANGGGYWLVAANGVVSRFGNAASFGAVSNPPSAVVGIAATNDGGGYWIAAASGHVYNFGDAEALGSATNPSGRVIGIAHT